MMRSVALLCSGGLLACAGEETRPATTDEVRQSLDGEALVNVGFRALMAEAAPSTIDVPICVDGAVEMQVQELEDADGELVEVTGMLHLRDCELQGSDGAVFDGALDVVALGPGYLGWRGTGVVDVQVSGKHYELHDVVVAIDQRDVGFYCIRAAVDLGDGAGDIVVGPSDCML